MAWEGSRSRGFPPATRRTILHRDPTCRCTGCPNCTPSGCTRPSTEADHIIEVADGGDHHPSNGQGMCHACHQAKTLAHATTKRRDRSERRRRPSGPHPGLRHGE